VASVEALGELDPERRDLNVEYVEDVAPGHLRMRVHERGVGETRSCGTGACAVVVATVLRTGEPRGSAYTVDVPGGRLEVTWQEDGHVLLTGPAVLVAEGVWTG
jgi:diaminopimelate epimerase